MREIVTCADTKGTPTQSKTRKDRRHVHRHVDNHNKSRLQGGIGCLEVKEKDKWHRDELREYNKEDAMRPIHQGAVNPKTEWKSFLYRTMRAATNMIPAIRPVEY
jgi:hypothetical protein